MTMNNTKKTMKGYANLIMGIPLIGVAASQVNTLPSGIAKKMAGTAVGLGSVALVSDTMKKVNFKFK